MLTLGQTFDEPAVIKVAGFCPGSDDFIALINQCTRKWLRRGDFDGTLVPIYLCTRGGCVVYPRYVKAVRKQNICNHVLNIKNNWYSFLGTDHCGWRQWCGDDVEMIGPVKATAYNEIPGDGWYVRAYVDARADIGKTIRIFGTDNNGQRLHTRESDGTWSDGKVITFAVPWGSTDTMVRHMERVVKDETTGPVRLYAYNAAKDVLLDLAYYEPSETNPSYARYQLGTGCRNGSCQSAPILSMVKLRYVPAKAPTDLVLIDNLDALGLMIQSVKAGEGGNTDLAHAYEQDAIREGNLELWDNESDSQVPIYNDPFHGAGVGHQRCY